MTKEIGQESSCGASIFALHFDYKLSDLARSKTMKGQTSFIGIKEVSLSGKELMWSVIGKNIL